jgi:hypothetical protein
MYILIVSTVDHMLDFTLPMTTIITLRPRVSICRIFHRHESDVMKRNVFSCMDIDRNDFQKMVQTTYTASLIYRSLNSKIPRHMGITSTIHSPDSLLWSPHSQEWRRGQLMDTFPPLITSLWFLSVKTKLHQRLKAEFLVQRFAHRRSFHPAFQVKSVGTRHSCFHKKRAYAT